MNYKLYSEFCKEINAISEAIINDAKRFEPYDDFTTSILMEYLKRISQNCLSASLLLENMNSKFELSLGLIFRANILDLINVYYLIAQLFILKDIDAFKLSILQLQSDGFEKQYKNMKFVIENANINQNKNATNSDDIKDREKVELGLSKLHSIITSKYSLLVDASNSVYPILKFKYKLKSNRDLISLTQKMIPVNKKLHPNDVIPSDEQLEFFKQIGNRFYMLYSTYSQYEHVGELKILMDKLPFESKHADLSDTIYIIQKSIGFILSLLMECNQHKLISITMDIDFKQHSNSISVLNKKMMDNGLSKSI